MPYSGPFHKGELECQALFDTSEEADALGRRMLQPVVSKPASAYIRTLPYVVVSFVNMTAIPGIAIKSSWSSMLLGREGFLSVSADGKTVSVSKAEISPNDPFKLNLESGLTIPVALMMISFENRSRYRINGWVKGTTEKIDGSVSFELKVEVAFGNCPKYIQSRTVTDYPNGQQNAEQIRLPPISPRASQNQNTSLDAAALALIQQCDTMFVATYSDATSSTTSVSTGGSHALSSDISHRGGQPGFLRVLSPTRLVWPEYQGNNMFITLGNIMSNPRVGLLLVDFAHRRLLQLSGNARLVKTDTGTAEDRALMMDGTNRSVDFTITEAVVCSPLNREFTLVDRSPYNPPRSGFNGTLFNTASASASSLASNQPSLMHLSKVTRLTDSIASFRFSISPPFRSPQKYYPGQFASINISLPNEGGDVLSINRSWTITAIDMEEDHHDPAATSVLVKSVELTIKRSSAPTALVSSFLHDTFAIDPEKAPVVWADMMKSSGLSFEFSGMGGTFSIFNTRYNGNRSDSSVLASSVMSSEGNVLLLSGGIGITPFLAMFRSLTDPEYIRAVSGLLNVTLMASFRSEEESKCMLPLLDCVSAIHGTSSDRIRVKVHVFITSNISTNVGAYWTANCHLHSGSRISHETIANLVPDVNQSDVYLCGPDRFMTMLSDGLINQFGLSESCIHTEEFTF